MTIDLKRELTPHLVSIITPAYNSAHFLPTLLESVKNQTYVNWELLIVIDNGTTDDTAAMVTRWSAEDPRIKLLQVPAGKGLALSRNFALKSANGQYVAFLDSDDFWLPEKLKKQIEFMKSQQLAISCTGYCRISEDLKQVGHYISVPNPITYKTLLINNVMGCLTVMIDQTVTGPLAMLETKHEDYLLWLAILKKGLMAGGLDQDLARYRIVKNSRSANKLEMIKYRWKILTQYERISFLESAHYLFLYGLTSLKKYSRF